MSTYAYHEVLNRAQQLTPDEQVGLMKELLALIRDRLPSAEPQHSILELEGSGKEVWEGIDVD
jgi:hypothetical protein